MERNMRVLICGGRKFDDIALLYKTMNLIDARRDITTVIDGGAKGADNLGRQWGLSRGKNSQTYNANWSKYGRSAGPKRNTQMLVEGKPDLVVAFSGGFGTANMIKQAKASGVEVIEKGNEDD
jgi:hypothetical protein